MPPKYHISYGQIIFKASAEQFISITWQIGSKNWIFLLGFFLKSQVVGGDASSTHQQHTGLLTACRAEGTQAQSGGRMKDALT